ncbi:MAG TPA: response regulator transcription factor [Phycisphaerae bacterium]|nr:response regulator transcription factor [Phycisphaerae bacterium]HRY67579.1 response regulator transcription factor [Phycisphaerae bacterium]HSA24966.1 response regulator transcription factor [Phycisphaerae bacterium]
MNQSQTTVSTHRKSILIVDDHALVRNMLADCIGASADLCVAGVACDAETALNEAIRLKPDIVLMDIDMPGMLCFDAARMIRTRCPDTRILFLSAFFHDRYIEQALAVEASGYVTKNEPPDALLKAIRAVAAGESYYSAEILARVVVTSDGVSLPESRHSRTSTLTQRELEILRYLVRGLAKKEIAELMHISVNTVNRHTDSIMTKLDIHDRVQLACFAIREGLAEA